MPIYEYQCKTCSRIFEKFQKISETPLTRCEGCGGEIARLISSTSFALKGSGWYKDGYAAPKKDAEKTKEVKEPKEKKKEETKTPKAETKR